MRRATLDLLRCPYCGDTLAIVENQALAVDPRDPSRIETAVLGCACCAFPVLAGIPVLIADDTARNAIEALEAGHRDEALGHLLGVSPSAVRDQLTSEGATTFRAALGLLCRDAEADYLLHRFSDPTYRVAEGLVRALAPHGADHTVLDLCGGAGHLTRAVRSAATLTADLVFWKLWLATRFVSPGCATVCCDANHPLPFPPDRFDMVVLTDAFPYIWHKRLLADEMMRSVTPDGVILMPHLHSARGENVSAGDTLTPAGYARLFSAHHPRLFRDARLFETIVDDGIVDLTTATPATDFGDDPSLSLVATPREARFARYTLDDGAGGIGDVIVNPLYQMKRQGTGTRLTLVYPTAEYAEEFAEARRYLPETVTVQADVTGTFSPEDLGADYEPLRRRRVLLDAPPGYC